MRQPQPGPNCLNCGKEVSTHRYCPDCGQLNDTHRLTFGELVADTFGNLFALDAKFFSTLWPLLRYPGQVAFRYVRGQKMRFVPPVRMYLLSTFILLFAYSLHSLVFEEDPFVVEATAPTGAAATDSSDEFTLQFGGDSTNFLERIQSHIKSQPDQNETQGLTALGYPTTFWNRFFYKQMYKVHHLDGDDFWNYFKNHLLLILFAFVPFFATLLSLFYLRRDAYYFDHLVFILYTQSVLFLSLATVPLLELVGLPDFSGPLLFGFGIYLFIAFKRFYNQGWAKTLLKFTIINAAYLVLAIVFLVLSTMVTFLIY